MNRRIEIDNFIKKYAMLYEQNPSFGIYADTIYSDLMSYGLTEEEFNEGNISNYFDEWINTFKRKRNIDVFKSPHQRNFLQFWNGNIKSNLAYVKIYLSFPKEHIYKAVNIIFDYIVKANIVTHSKVSDKIRADSVVLRIGTQKDADKVMHFINNNNQLKSMHRPTNPFLIKNGIVGIAYDGNLSYNSALSFLLQKFYEECRINNTLKQADMNSFREFVIRYKNNMVANVNNMKSFIEETKYRDRFTNDGDFLNNYVQIFDLIILSLNPSVELEDFKRQFIKFEHSVTDHKFADYYNNALSSDNSNNLNKAIEILNQYIDYAKGKYGYGRVELQLQIYMDGRLRAITRDNNFRTLFRDNVPVNLLKQIVNGNLKDYVRKRLTATDISYSYNIFYNACFQTLSKYGFNQLESAIVSGLNGNYSRFTNSNGNWREQLFLLDKETFAECVKYFANKNASYSNMCLNCCQYFQNEYNRAMNTSAKMR